MHRIRPRDDKDEYIPETAKPIRRQSGQTKRARHGSSSTKLDLVYNCMTRGSLVFWKQITISKGFDSSRTRFPLRRNAESGLLTPDPTLPYGNELCEFLSKRTGIILPLGIHITFEQLEKAVSVEGSCIGSISIDEENIDNSENAPSFSKQLKDTINLAIRLASVGKSVKSINLNSNASEQLIYETITEILNNDINRRQYLFIGAKTKKNNIERAIQRIIETSLYLSNSI